MLMLERALSNLDAYEPIVLQCNFFVERIPREYSTMKTRDVRRDVYKLLLAMEDIVIKNGISVFTARELKMSNDAKIGSWRFLEISQEIP
jgi:hypothetical protein